MTCRHAPGDHSCTTRYPIYNNIVNTEPLTPDSKKFEILEVIDSYLPYLILKVKYPNCNKCSYEGTKILVYENLSIKDLIYWKEIDPHFSNSKSKDKTKSPSPIARFPASVIGMTHACRFIEMLKYEDKSSNKS
jgi:hypothetical protein